MIRIHRLSNSKRDRRHVFVIERLRQEKVLARFRFVDQADQADQLTSTGWEMAQERVASLCQDFQWLAKI